MEQAKEQTTNQRMNDKIQLGRIKRIKLNSCSSGFGILPVPGKEIEQHLTICSDGRVYFSRYCFQEDLNYIPKVFFKEQFKISPSRSNYILSCIGMYFEEVYEDLSITDVGGWSLEVINEKDEKQIFYGSFLQDLNYRGEQISRLIREFTNRPHMYCFDGDAREALQVNEDEFIFVDVYLEDFKRIYTYICEDKFILEDDIVVVPVGVKNTEMTGSVEKVQVLKRENAPYPVEHCKKVIRRW